METDARLDRRRYYAAMSQVDLRTACQRIQEQFDLPEFYFDVEAEGNDYWNYASARGSVLGFNLTRIGEYGTPSKWTWLWGAPTKANYQVIVYWNSSNLGEQGLKEIETLLEQFLECRIVRYPGSDVHMT